MFFVTFLSQFIPEILNRESQQKTPDRKRNSMLLLGAQHNEGAMNTQAALREIFSALY